MLSRRALLAAAALTVAALRVSRAGADTPTPPGPSWQHALIAAARKQVGVTVRYDPSYVRLAYPGGDVPLDRGVCTDVIIRAYRAALQFDLQQHVHEDMKGAFSAYPSVWGMTRPDPSIDHRRVPNLMVFFRRQGASLPVLDDPAAYQPGDIVTQMLPGNLPHILIVSSAPSAQVPDRHFVLHNIGAGAREEDTLFAYPRTGHFRFNPSLASSHVGAGRSSARDDASECS